MVKIFHDYVTPTGSSAGAALTTDANGSCSGTFAIPNPADTSKPKWRTGTRTFRLTSNSTNSLVQGVFTSAETDYQAKGLMSTVQGTILSTREGSIAQASQSETTVIRRGGSRTETAAAPKEVRGGQEYHTFTPDQAGRDAEAAQRKRFAKQEAPPQAQKQNISQFKVGNNHPFSGTAAGKPGTAPKYSKPPRHYFSCYRDPVAQSFIIDVPGGAFIPSVDLYFATKSTTMPVTVELRTMENGFPTRKVLPFSQVNVAAADIIYII